MKNIHRTVQIQVHTKQVQGQLSTNLHKRPCTTRKIQKNPQDLLHLPNPRTAPVHLWRRHHQHQRRARAIEPEEAPSRDGFERAAKEEDDSGRTSAGDAPRTPLAVVLRPPPASADEEEQNHPPHHPEPSSHQPVPLRRREQHHGVDSYAGDFEIWRQPRTSETLRTRRPRSTAILKNSILLWPQYPSKARVVVIHLLLFSSVAD